MFYNSNKDEVRENLNKSSKELLEYVDLIINRDMVDINNIQKGESKCLK